MASPTKDLEFKNSLVAFIDVLGFREMVSSSDKAKMHYYFRLVRRTIEKAQPLSGELYGTQFQIMSDSIVISSPVPKNTLRGITTIDVINNTCHLISILQYALAQVGIWIRGGIAIGEIAFDTEYSIVAGPGLVEAYELEQVAKYPRVVLSPRILDYLEFNRYEFIQTVNARSKNDFFEVAPIYIPSQALPQYQRECFNDFLFVDYFSHIIDEPYTLSSSGENIYFRLKEELYRSPKTIGKHQWTRDYILSLPYLEEAARNDFKNL